MSLQKEITTFSIENLFGSGNYVIPIYQRNYSWKEGQIVQLIHDINDYAKQNPLSKYYIGTLVVYERESEKEIYYETIDGQQRLTTLSILYTVLKNEYDLAEELIHFKKIVLSFENRIQSTNALNFAFKGDFNTTIKYNTSIEDAYNIIKKELQNLFGKKDNVIEYFKTFVKYINQNVVLLRVKVPQETDLNHYFEVMNNRGEQLEKHEVLKSLLLSYLDKISDETEREESKLVFNMIWEGCSQMERYIQYCFEKDQREKVFGYHWDGLMVGSFDELRTKLDFKVKSSDIDEQQLERELEGVAIDEIIRNLKYDKVVYDGSSETAERFNSVINFQNFLLHCLLIQTKDKDATLDDKKLISNFDFLKNESDVERIYFVKNYAFTILKAKFLMDQYVIKREFINNKEAWSLKRLYYYNDKSQSYINTFDSTNVEVDSRDIILLLSMFHTVAPNMMYKHWLNASLSYLYENYSSTERISIEDYKVYLLLIAKQLVFNRFIAKQQVEYFDIIYGTPSLLINEQNLDWGKLRYDRVENNLVFNYIDYLLIKDVQAGNTYYIKEVNKFVNNFEFKFRSSVEHYYPQNPKEGFEKLEDGFLHSIGNLTLISHSKNSAMNNYMPKAKKEHYRNGQDADSVKQYIMFNKYPDLGWGEKEIKQHEEEIINLLRNQIN